jgi:hypothetical protein
MVFPPSGFLFWSYYDHQIKKSKDEHLIHMDHRIGDVAVTANGEPG